jgi:hypothetical protein
VTATVRFSEVPAVVFSDTSSVRYPDDVIVPAEGLSAVKVCELPECREPVPAIRGREGQIRYCCPEHRGVARRRRLVEKLS